MESKKEKKKPRTIRREEKRVKSRSGEVETSENSGEGARSPASAWGVEISECPVGGGRSFDQAESQARDPNLPRQHVTRAYVRA